MGYFRSPLNWVGNKYKFLSTIDSIVAGKQYDKVVECFMGAGNILFNINVQANTFIGNDKNKLTPMFYRAVKDANTTYTIAKFDEVLDKHNRFKDKSDYYTFRDDWNVKYLADIVDEDFIYETIMLLKMCSNSMVRFNPKGGYFNQGFRGLSQEKLDAGNGFFTDTMKKQCIKRLNNLSIEIQKRNYKFSSVDFQSMSEIKEENNLLILDPPYILSTAMYDTDYNAQSDEKLFDLIKKTGNDFLYFNYLKSGDYLNQRLLDVVDKYDFQIVEINDKTLSGQGRVDTKEVSEVIIHNITV